MTEGVAVQQLAQGFAQLFQLLQTLGPAQRQIQLIFAALLGQLLFPTGQILHQVLTPVGQGLLPVRTFLGCIQHPVSQIFAQIIGESLDTAGQLVDLAQAAVDPGDGAHGGGQVHRHDGDEAGQPYQGSLQ